MPGKGPIMPMAWEPQLLKDAKKKARPHGSSAGRRAPERGRTTKSRKMRDQPRDVDEICEECSDHFNCASQIYDLLACNYHPTSYCVMTLFLVGTLSWNVGIASHVHNKPSPGSKYKPTGRHAFPLLRSNAQTGSTAFPGQRAGPVEYTVRSMA